MTRAAIAIALLTAILTLQPALAQTPATLPAGPVSTALPAAPQGIGLSRIATIHRNLEYIRRGNHSLNIDLYVPKDPPETRLPVLIWIHGGGWKAGNKAFIPGLAPMLARGFAMASVQYRFSQEAKFPAQIDDCRDAVRFLREHASEYRLDPNRIGAWGGSAGGHLVALLGTMPDDPANLTSARVQAVCDLYGPTEMVAMGRYAATWPKRGQDDPVADLFGGPIESKLAEARQASPLTYVSANSAPFLILHGTKDPLVPLEQSHLLTDALKKAGVPADLIILEGAGHATPEFDRPENLAKIADFFAAHLR